MKVEKTQKEDTTWMDLHPWLTDEGIVDHDGRFSTNWIARLPWLAAEGLRKFQTP